MHIYIYIGIYMHAYCAGCVSKLSRISSKAFAGAIFGSGECQTIKDLEVEASCDVYGFLQWR